MSFLAIRGDLSTNPKTIQLCHVTQVLRMAPSNQSFFIPGVKYFIMSWPELVEAPNHMLAQNFPGGTKNNYCA